MQSYLDCRLGFSLLLDKMLNVFDFKFHEVENILIIAERINMLKHEALELLNQRILACTKCDELVVQRQSCNGKIVPGAGSSTAKLMIIGEAPGQQEEKDGLPFVGKAGSLLTNILKAAGWNRDDVFIANTIKCRPPSNRDPKPEEAANCRQFLEMQIRVIDPVWILCLGRIASIYLLGKDSDATIGSLRGVTHEYDGRKVICTYHPSYLLRTPAVKEEVWKDIQPIILDLCKK